MASLKKSLTVGPSDDISQRLADRWRWGCIGKCDRVGYRSCDVPRELVLLLVRQLPVRGEMRSQLEDWAARLPFRNLGLRSSFPRCSGMSHKSIGDALEKGRACARTDICCQVLHRLAYSENIHAIDCFRRNAER